MNGIWAGYKKNTSYIWGVSFGSSRKPEQVCLQLGLDEMNEGYLIDRINREGRHGRLIRLQPGIWEYTIECWDSAEMIPWLRTFTGRIINFTCSNKQVEQRAGVRSGEPGVGTGFLSGAGQGTG